MLIEIKPMPSYARDWHISVKHIPDRLHLAVVYIAKKSIAFKTNMHDQEIHVNIECISKKFIQHLNKKHREKDEVTNVLSFSSDMMPKNMKCPRVLGDVFLCQSYIKEEAKELDRSFEDHFIHMAAHGVLHLVGYDHENDDEALIMKDVEKKLLRNFNISLNY